MIPLQRGFYNWCSDFINELPSNMTGSIIVHPNFGNYKVHFYVDSEIYIAEIMLFARGPSADFHIIDMDGNDIMCVAADCRESSKMYEVWFLENLQKFRNIMLGQSL